MQILFHSVFQLLFGVAQNHSVNGAVTEVTVFFALCHLQIPIHLGMCNTWATQIPSRGKSLSRSISQASVNQVSCTDRQWM